MKRISVDVIKDGYILARDIISSTNVILMIQGTMLKEEYIPRLKDLHIGYIYVNDASEMEVEEEKQTEKIIEEEIQKQCQETIKDTMQKYSYNANEKLQEIVKIAEDIITDVLSQPEVMYNISCVRVRSESIYSHSLNVAALSVLLAMCANVPKKRIKDIAIAGLLHDIGFNSMDPRLQTLIYEECNEDDKREIKRHVIQGFSDVEHANWLSKAVKEVILQHHERLDGSGYPFHMTGDRLRLEVKIVSLCDEFDHMVYGHMMKRYKVHEAMDYLLSQAGVKFDFELVQLFMETVAAYPVGTIVRTNSNETAVVIRQNYKFPTRPVIRILEYNDGTKCTEWLEKDLTKCLTLFITDTIEE